MGVALEHISGSNGNNAALTNITMATGDTLTIRAQTDLTKSVWLMNAWAMIEAAGFYEIHSPRMHDNVHGIRVRVPLNNALPEHSLAFPTKLFTLDTLTVQLAGTSGVGSISPMSLLIYYEDLPGIQARLTTIDDVVKRMVNLMAQEVTITGAVTGSYSAAVALNANFDFTKANTDYALLGFTVDANCEAICLRGADTGNLRVAAPGLNTFPQLSAEWFWRLTQRSGKPCIPILNANNKGGILLDNLTTHTGGTFNVNVHLAELARAA
jgi:hypothetical protein